VILIVNQLKAETVQLQTQHNRKSFDCGIEPLNSFLKMTAMQNEKKNLTRTYILSSEENKNTIVGYFTLTTGEALVPDDAKKPLRKYPHPAPILKIARLAVDEDYQNQGIGKFLLFDILHKAVAMNNALPFVGVFVDAKNIKAKDYYIKYGFAPITSDNQDFRLWLPMDTIIKGLKA
jgi:ribosomal protein S18 acetylase RimI-like enzyme